MSSLTPTPAHSTDTEQSLLGAFLIDADQLLDVIDEVSPDDFYDPVHRTIFQAMQRLVEQESRIDILTLTNQLQDYKDLNDAGGSAFIAELATVTPTSANAREYAGILRKKAVHRAVAKAGASISKLSADEALDANQLLERAEEAVLSISCKAHQHDPHPFADVLARVVKGTQSPQDAVSTGFSSLDQYLEGLKPGSLNIIAARPGMGKTALALNIACHAVERQQKQVAFFSMEMDAEELVDRAIANKIGAQEWKQKKAEMTFDELQEFAEQFKPLSNLHIDDDSDSSLTNIRSKARRQKLRHGLDLLIIDYLQLIRPPDHLVKATRTEQVTHTTTNLKSLARNLRCPVIAMSQLNRAVESRPGNIPLLADLRESGSIEQDADLVLMLYREEAYNEDCDKPGVTDVFVRKHRNGRTGRAELYFDGDRMTFTSLEKRAGDLPSM